MAWNNGYESKKFKEEQNRLAAEYRAAGMTEYQIEQMKQYDLNAFNSKRRYFEHTQQFPKLPTNVDEEDGLSPIYEKFASEFSVELDISEIQDRFWWIEEIDDPSLAREIKNLTKDDIELITLYAFDNYSQDEISIRFGISQRGVSKRIEKLSKIFKKFS